MDRSATLRAFYADLVATKAAATNPRIRHAFATVPREPFAGPGPWHIRVFGPWWRPDSGRTYIQTPDADPAYLYQDTLVALDPARGINIGEPSLHALCLDALAPPPRATIHQIGAGSGYYTALLSELAGPRGQVHAYEIDPALAARAQPNLTPWPQARIHLQDGATTGLPPADAIYVNAGLTQPHPAWLDALRPGGRLLFPLQPERSLGGMLLIERPPDAPPTPAWPARFISRAAFIPCQGQQVAATGRGLATAFAAGGWDQVRSFRRGPPDPSCWFDGGTWWLSTAAA